MIVGFTGTRAGMTAAQKLRVRQLLEEATEAHHGDAIGADEDFHRIAMDLGVPVLIHPPENPKQRAFCQGARVVYPEKPYLRRNQHIVLASTKLVAAPKEDNEPPTMRGQGTWSTVRFARKARVPYEIVWPDGTPA